MEEIFDMDKLDSSFGGKGSAGFNYEAYAMKMREDDKKMAKFADSGCSSPSSLQSLVAESRLSESTASDNEGDEDEISYNSSNMEKDDESCKAIHLAPKMTEREA